jgi:hypothetical protein
MFVRFKNKIEKAVFTSENINSDRSKYLRKIYSRNYLQILRIPGKRCIFIDDSEFNLYLRRTLLDQHMKALFCSRSINAGLNNSLISAVSDLEVIYHRIISVSVNCFVFMDLILLIRVC